ncbi:MAG: CBS domain-containing protein [Alphaproteobacteria bacterium]|jgi:CBS domain-containing protein
MKIKDQPNFKQKPKPITFLQSDMVQQALDIMCEKNIGSILITDNNNKVIGIVTERDMMIRVLKTKINPETTPLSDIMSIKVRIACETDNLIDWIQTMSDQRFRHLPVINEQGELITIMSQGDFLAYTWPELYEKIKRDLKGRLGRSFQYMLIILGVVVLGLIAFKL